MLIESYLTGVFLCMTYGSLICWILISIFTSIPVFLTVYATTLYFKKHDKKMNWLTKLFLTESYLVIAWLILFLIEGTGLQAIAVPLAYGAGIFFFIETPLTIAYQKIMTKHEMLPWHLMQYLTCLAGTMIFWSIIIFYFRTFSLVSSIA